MAATVTLRKYTGVNAATESDPVAGADLISADNAINSLANRQAYPVTVGTNSYESWLRLKIDVAPANAITNVKIWGDGAAQVSTSLMFTSGYVTGTTPVATTSAIANAAFTTYTSGNKAVWDASTYTTAGAITKAVVFQLQVDASCGPGTWTQEVASFAFDET
jgi:uncharacterized Rossmann fold enzyme